IINSLFFASWCSLFFILFFLIITFTFQPKTYANGNAKSESFFFRYFALKYSRKYPRTAAVGKKGKKGKNV
ncbi:MAG: hypothetical protein ABJF11_10400, partial [Reichenbachiella sp.]|uniref:hypothetical protein n=1 Tax=Reichenbachiella sp. TaxID=2184521 RepID=UPI0032673100